MSPTNDDDPLRVGATSRVREATPADGPEAADAAASVEAAAAPDPAGIEAIAADLAAGEISPLEARERLVDAVLAAELPADLPAEEVAAIRAEVADALFDDPVFAALLAGADEAAS